MNLKHLRFLAVAATDRTFERATLGDRVVWVGKCIHCSRKLTIDDHGAPIGAATLEHIWPRNHDGDDALRNLALACAGCNREKGRRHDTQRRDDPRLAEIVEQLQRRRAERWRDPADVGLAERIARLTPDPDDPGLSGGGGAGGPARPGRRARRAPRRSGGGSRGTTGRRR